MLFVIEESPKGKFEETMELAIIQIDIVAAAHVGIVGAQLLRIHGIEIGCVRRVLDLGYVRRLLLAHVGKVDALEEVVALHLIHALPQPLVRRGAKSSN